jgi:hypothetical protein
MQWGDNSEEQYAWEKARRAAKYADDLALEERIKARAARKALQATAVKGSSDL